MNKKNIQSLIFWTIISTILLLIVGTSYVFSRPKNTSSNLQTITSFEECVAAGNPVMESYPEQCAADGQTFTRDITNNIKVTDEIVIDNPQPNSVAVHTISINGQARGYWFFEGSFPVTLEDPNTKETLLESYVTAQSAWITENFVTFEGFVKLTNNLPKQVNLIFKKSNPSGITELDQSIVIPIHIQTNPE